MKNLLNTLDLSDDPIRASGETMISSRRMLVVVVLFLYYMKSLFFLLDAEFWAEDGPVFFSEAWHYGWKSLGRNQAGYYVVIIRLIAYVSTLPPIQHAALICSAASVVVTALPVYLIFSRRSDQILPGATSKAIFGLVYLIGPASYEIYGNMTNVQWFLPVWILLFIFSSPSGNRPVRVLEYIFLSLATLTGPFVIFIFPIYALLLVFRQVKLDYAVAAILIIAFFIQGYSILSTPQASGHLTVITLLKYISTKLALSGLTGIRGQRLIFNGSPNILVFVVCTLIWIYTSVRALVSGTAFTRVLVVFGNLVFVAGCRKFADYFSLDPEVGARYGWFGVTTYLYLYYFIASRTRFHFERIVFYSLFSLSLLAAIPLDLTMFNPKNIDWKNEVRSFRWLHTGDTLKVKTDPVPWSFPLVKKNPSEILGTEESDSINYIVSLRIQNNRLTTTDAWTFMRNESTSGNQVFLVLRSENEFYVFTSEPQHRPEVSVAYKNDYNWAGFTISQSIARVKEGKYDLGIFIYNRNTKKRCLKYITRDFEVSRSGDPSVAKDWHL